MTVDDLLEITGPSFLTSDPPRYDALRDILKSSFWLKQIATLDGTVRTHVGALIADLDDEVDVVEAFTRPLPVRVLCELLGVSARRRGDAQAVVRSCPRTSTRRPSDTGRCTECGR